MTPGSLPVSQSSCTAPSASCGYCCALCPTRGRYPGKIRFIEPQGVNGHRRPVSDSPQQYATGEPGKVQGRDRVGIVEGFCGYRARAGQYSGKIWIIDNSGVQG